MSNTPLWSFCHAPALRGNMSLHSDSVGSFADLWCSAAIDLSKAPPLAPVDVTDTGMVFPFRYTVVHCCTGSLLALYSATAVMLGCAGGEGYVVAGVGVMVMMGYKVWATRNGCEIIFSAACCVEVHLSAAADTTFGSEISWKGVAVAGGVYVGVFLAAIVLHTSLMRSAIGPGVGHCLP